MLNIKSDKLKNKKIALCVTGSIAAILAPKLARELRRHGAEVKPYMTKNATKIIHPYALEWACEEEAVLELTGRMEHLEKFDIVLIAPATANTISKIASGIADNAVTALALCNKNVVVAPAMHREMFESKIFSENLNKLRELGFTVVEPCIEEGSAKMASINEIVDFCIRAVYRKTLSGKRVLITAGATQEKIDPIRVITNRSSGKMGLALAREAFFRGAEVSVILGSVSVEFPRYLKKVFVESSEEMLNAVKEHIDKCDVFISVAAVSDFKPKISYEKKIKTRERLFLELVSTKKILEEIKDKKAVKVGFKALYNVSEEELIKSAKEILEKRNLSVVVANDLEKNYFGSDSNEVFIVTREDVVKFSGRKEEVAEKVIDVLEKFL